MTDEPDRITRLETLVATLTANVDKLESSVQTLVTNQGRPNWSALGVMLSALAMMGAMCAALIFGPISANEKNIAEVQARGESLDTQIREMVIAEQQRNNAIGERLAKEEAVTWLYTSGMLRNPEAK